MALMRPDEIILTVRVVTSENASCKAVVVYPGTIQPFEVQLGDAQYATPAGNAIHALECALEALRGQVDERA